MACYGFQDPDTGVEMLLTDNKNAPLLGALAGNRYVVDYAFEEDFEDDAEVSGMAMHSRAQMNDSLKGAQLDLQDLGEAAHYLARAFDISDMAYLG
jgi:hypothetical protein